jgi:periplasmic copper chaperone A
MRHLLRRARRRTSVFFVTLVALLAIAPAASAHVTVSSPDATPGGFGKLVFRVPSESETASTVKLTVTLPADTPFANVSAKTMPGWSVATTEKKLDKPIKNDDGFNLTKAISTVTWTAEKGQGVEPGEFNEFELSVGPFPEGSAPITLPVVQTYSDGEAVTWNEPTPASGEEPEHPAPTFELAAATAPTAAPTAGTSADAPTTAESANVTASGGDTTDGLARWMGGIGLALVVAALVVAILSTRRRAA